MYIIQSASSDDGAAATDSPPKTQQSETIDCWKSSGLRLKVQKRSLSKGARENMKRSEKVLIDYWNNSKWSSSHER